MYESVILEKLPSPLGVPKAPPGLNPKVEGVVLVKRAMWRFFDDCSASGEKLNGCCQGDARKDGSGLAVEWESRRRLWGRLRGTAWSTETQSCCSSWGSRSG